MSVRPLLAVLVATVFGNAAAADSIFIVRNYRAHCCSRVTEICRIPCPPQLPMPKMMGDGTGHPPGQLTTLNCRDWQGGRYFTDQAGRRWQLASPVPLRQPPQQLTGMLFRGPEGQALLMTSDKQVFVELPKP